jgi:prepilin-type N-terminal cleavage/methylation domain-containing protein/prepilin-type processing-associated H-X9-DG protein
MSILRPWPCKRRSDWPAGHPRRPRARWGFTLIELLVVVAVIVVLLSILLPSWSSAREQARAVVCGQHLRQFGTGLQNYTAENRDWIPGLNTTGVALTAKWGFLVGDGGNPTIFDSPRLPVQTFDWMTPILAYSLELPAQRAQRFKFLLSRFRCPAQVNTNAALYCDTDAPDMDLFGLAQTWPGVSYLMPGPFQYTGQKYKDRVLCPNEAKPTHAAIRSKAMYDQWEVLVNDYQPRFDRLGPPARKIFVADGTRYLRKDGILDFDVAPIPDFFGAFSDPGGWWSGARAYGVRPGSMAWDGIQATGQRGRNPDDPDDPNDPRGGQNLGLSYRHGRQHGVPSGDVHDNAGTINGLFFDGHVARMTDRQSRHISYWYPSGGKVQTPEEGMTRVPEHFVIP